VKIFAQFYFILVAVLALWAWCIQIAFLHSPGDHLLPGGLLLIAALPTSLSILPLRALWPSVFASGFVQLSLFTFCGIVQTLVLFGGARLLPRKYR
jgi:hypothetical protein